MFADCNIIDNFMSLMPSAEFSLETTLFRCISYKYCNYINFRNKAVLVQILKVLELHRQRPGYVSCSLGLNLGGSSSDSVSCGFCFFPLSIVKYLLNCHVGLVN